MDFCDGNKLEAQQSWRQRDKIESAPASHPFIKAPLCVAGCSAAEQLFSAATASVYIRTLRLAPASIIQISNWQSLSGAHL